MPDRFRCQTAGCEQPFRVVTLDVEDSSTDYECLTCCMVRNLAILRSLAEQGLIDLGDLGATQE